MSTRIGRPVRTVIASSASTALAFLVAGALIVAGCGGSAPRSAASAEPVQARHLHKLFPGLNVRYGGVARLTKAAPPLSAALPGANDLLVAGSSRASTVLAATDLGIFRSTDGGATWRPVLTGVEAWSLTAAASGGYAAIGNLPGKPNFGPAVLVTSADGVHWRVRKVTAPRSVIPFGGGYRLAMSGIGPHATGIAVADTTWAFYSSPALRSTDGGLRWTRIGRTLPRGGFNGATFTDHGRVAFVTAPGPGKPVPSQHCAGAVYRSANAGATWSQMPTSCERYPLTALQFINARQGLAAGGLGYKEGGALVVESTSDGGRTWRTIERTKAGNPAGSPQHIGIVRLDMVSAQDGWAIAGGCEGGQNGPCDGTVLVTTDGGHQWRATSQPAVSLAGLGAAGQVAVAGDDRSATTATTIDGGRTWTLRTPPRWIATTAFAGTGSSQVWATNLGNFLSADAGSTWTSAGQLRATRYAYENWLAGAPRHLLGYTESMDIVTSADGGQTFTTSRVPDASTSDILLTAALGTSGRAIAVTGAGDDCLSSPGPALRRIEKLKPGWKPSSGASTLYTSGDGGAHWGSAGIALPFGVQTPAAAAADGSLVAIFDACNKLEVSADGGSGWHSEAIAKDVFCTVSALATSASAHGELWLTCQAGQGGFWVLHSVNAGASWTVFWLPASAGVNGMTLFGPGPSPVINPIGASATEPGGAVMPGGGSLWRTTDGGKSWRQSWVGLG